MSPCGMLSESPASAWPGHLCTTQPGETTAGAFPCCAWAPFAKKQLPLVTQTCFPYSHVGGTASDTVTKVLFGQRTLKEIQRPSLGHLGGSCNVAAALGGLGPAARSCRTHQRSHFPGRKADLGEAKATWGECGDLGR